MYYSVCVLKDIKTQYLMTHNVVGISMKDWNKCRSTISLSVIHSIYIFLHYVVNGFFESMQTFFFVFWSYFCCLTNSL